MAAKTPPALPLPFQLGALGIIFIALLFITPIFYWYWCRIEPGEGRFAVLIRKAGKEPAGGAVIAGKDEKGIQLEVLPEGRYFYNPYTWGWEYHDIDDIPAGQLGVLTRLYGKDLPAGEILAKEGYKGVVADVLSPGKYRINPYAYKLEKFEATSITPGFVGVQVSLVGTDTLTSNPEEKSTFIVPPGQKGVIEATLDPGTYYLNPYIYSVVPLNLQSQRFEMAGEDAIDFLTSDGFTVKVEGTVEYAVDRKSAAKLTHQVGDLDDMLQKVILPHVRGFARIEGSKGQALNYIVGEMRQQFQDKLYNHLKEECGKWGIEIRSVLVRNISAPDEIARVIRDRELAKQAAIMYEQQISQAKSKAELARQEMLAVQNKEKVNAETTSLQAQILAKQEAAVRLTAAQQNLSVAQLQKQAAEEQAQATLARAGGEQSVIRAENEAAANVMAQQSEAFGGGLNYAKYLFYQRVGPQIKSVFTNDDPGGLGALFNAYLPAAK